MLRKGEEPVPGYRLVRFLGRGQYGEVWQANGPGGTRVALKFIDVGGAQGRKELRGVQRVKEIRHPHLMPIAALWLLDEDGTPLDDSYFQVADGDDQRKVLNATLKVEAKHPSLLVVAMGYCDKNLSNRLAEVNEGIPRAEWQGIPVAELLVHMVESAKAIDFLNAPRHDLGDGLVSIQHCDVKPDNIMLVGGAVQVCDFGLARMMGDNLKATATGMVGSPAFMAPECIRKHPSSASDQYSLAITYYELRTGRLPFHDLSYMAVLDSHQAGALDFSALGDAEQAVLRRATELEPGDRYATCLEMVGALGEALAAELPDLRSSPAAGKLRAQQSVARASATDTARATRTTREHERRSRQGSHLRAKLGLGLALLTLVGIGVAVVFAIFDVHEAVFGDGQRSLTESEEPSPESGGNPVEPIDFEAMLAKAEQTLQEGDLVEAALEYGELERLLESSAEASASLRDSARLGTLRVKVRQPDSDWDSLLEQVQWLKLENGADGQNGTRAVALELIVKAASGKAPVRERIKLLVQLWPRVERLDVSEQAKIEAIKSQASAELAQTDASLDAAMLADLKILGIDRVGLLLALAERQHQQGDFESSRQTLTQARPDATGEQQNRLAELLLLNDLADDTFDAQAAVSRFASVAENLQDPTEVVALLLDRAWRAPEIIDTAVEQLARVGRAARVDERAKLEKAYASLLALRVRTRLSKSDVSVADLMRDCEQVRTVDPTDPLVNMCWVECRILSPGSELDRTTWTQLDTIVQRAIDSKDAESPHVAYFHFVAGLLLHHHPTPRSRDGAEEILKIRDMDAALLQAPHRRQQIAEILVAGATAIGLPTDVGLLDDRPARDDTKTAYSYMEFASRWEDPPSDAWKANYIIAAALVGDPQVADKWLQLSDELLASEVSKAFLESEKRIGLTMLLSAGGYKQRFEEGRHPVDRIKAIQLYAALINRLHDPRRVNAEFPDLALYNKVVQPAYELASLSIPGTGAVPSELKPSLASIYGVLGRLLERDVAVGQQDIAKSVSAEQAFLQAKELEARAENLAGIGRAIINSPDYDERLPELKGLCADILALDDQHADGYALHGSALVIESRLKTKRSESRELLLPAIEACNEAVKRSQPGDDDYASNHEVLSAANLETAFFADALEEKEKHLQAAVKEAEKAIAVKNRPRPENAYNCLGNALEDQAFYLNDVEKVAKYELALRAFIDGAGEASDAGRDASNSLYAAGRCRLRLAHSLPKSERGKALEQAEYELDLAIKNWRLFSQKKKAIQRRLGEAQFWRSEVIRARAMGLPTIAEALPVLGEAELARAESVKLAKSAQSIYWDEFQVEWSKLALDQAKSSDSFDEAKPFLTNSADRAQEVLTESERGSSSIQVSPQAIQDALTQLIYVDLARCGWLTSSTDSRWTPTDEKEAEGYALDALKTAERFQDEAISRSAKIAAHTQVGNVKWKSARNPNFRQTAADAWDSAEKSFREAVQLGGNHVGLTVEARRGLVISLKQRISEAQVASEKTKLRDESLQLLAPIDLKQVDANIAREISRLISELKTVN